MKDEALKLALEALSDFDYDKRLSAITAIKQVLEAVQEPVGEIRWAGNVPDSIREPFWIDYISPPVGTKLYTTPPAQRQWVGLTDEEAGRCLRDAFPVGGVIITADTIKFARAIEQALKEKNT